MCEHLEPINVKLSLKTVVVCPNMLTSLQRLLF